jgi:hypothetical protein
MAITLRQNPTSPNIGNSNLLNAVTSNSSSNAQYRFVVDVKDDNGDLLQRLKQQPNPSNTGIFDVGNIIPTYLGNTDRVWDITTPTANTFCGKDFQIKFGEEWAFNTTGSVVLFNGIEDAAGNPAVSGSDYIFILNGVLDPNDQVNWNWNSGSKYHEEDPIDDVVFSHQFGLTAFDVNKVKSGDFHTISLLRGNTNGDSNVVDTSAQDVFAATYRQYDATGSLLDTDVLYDTFTGLRTSQVERWSDVYLNQDETTRLVHWPAGPQNIEDAGVPILADTSYYTITFNAQATDTFVNEDGVWGEYRFNITEGDCDYPGVRFAWKNEYGVWDYFNFNLAESTTSNVTRESYKQSFVNYSAPNQAPYRKERRGESQYVNQVSKTRSAQSDYLSQTEADNLRELFYSTEVYIQDGTQFLPVVITNATLTEKTNPRSQKLFTYNVEYKMANDTRSRV